MAAADIAIVGGGLIGLAIARQLAIRFPTRSIVVFEKEKRVGLGISSRSSEVIHAGLYYPPQSLKSIWCVRGREQLYQYCRQWQIPHRRIGKLVVAHTQTEQETLQALAARAQLNGVDDLVWISREKLAILEPFLQAHTALLSPSTGIIDSAALLRCLEKEALERGVSFALQTQVCRIDVSHSCYRIFFHGTHDATNMDVLQTPHLINAAGLQAVALARCISGFPSLLLPEMLLVKGNYFAYHGHNPFRHLVYPAPPAPLSASVPAGLGIHATLDLQGQLRFGPDAEVVQREQYDVSATRKELFVQAIRRYFPSLDADKLQPAYAGIRPRLRNAENQPPDFIVQTAAHHGLPGLVNLFGVESPGLTSCLALAEQLVNDGQF